MKQLKNLMLVAFVALGIGMATVPAVQVSAASSADEACQALVSNTTCTNPKGSVDIANVIRTIIIVFSYIVGLVALVMIITGGLKYITSSGDSNKIASAKNTLIYAVIGLVIVALSQFIVQFVLKTATATPKATPAPITAPRAGLCSKPHAGSTCLQ